MDAHLQTGDIRGQSISGIATATLRQGGRLLRGARSMRRTLIAALILSASAIAHAGTHHCPSTYPGKASPGLPLTGGMMMWGELPTDGTRYPSGWSRGDDRPARDGIDILYGLSEPPDPNWLVCEYGSRKRIKGRFRDGHEWGQYMEGHGKESWFIRLPPEDINCTLQTREAKSHQPSTWTVTAACTR